MSPQEIRNTFLKFFEDKKHKIVSSAPLVIKNDPTLMFTNAGMNQFKDWFLGNEPAKYSRVADTQKCLRVTGKHNDLEDVGHDTYHHTMFEMLGNWSFGDPKGGIEGQPSGYFKKEAIEWAWELLTDVYKLDKNRLYVTVFEGDKTENLDFDQEAYDHWSKLIDPARIINGNKKDNFWEMGDTGPCGPCSEIHVDLRSDEERSTTDGKSLVNNDHPQVIEIWNLVFMEFNRLADGSLKALPARHVDTGMGFERLVRAIAAKSSNYDTEIFQPLIRKTAELTGIEYGKDEQKDIAHRVIADHIRTIAFAIADGQLPSNTGAGYVIRRILRRAVRYGYSYLGLNQPFLNKLVPVMAEQFFDIFPELDKQKEFISRVISEEEQAFLKTLENGLKRIQDIISTYKNDDKTIGGSVVFELYDTFGFPVDLTALVLKEKGFKLDEKGFEQELERQRKRSRDAAAVDASDWNTIKDIEKSEFIGYDQLRAKVQITRWRKVKSKDKELYQLVFDRTPFYAESGGQVGDTGYIQSEHEKIEISDTQKENNLIIHISAKLPQVLDVPFQAYVDEEKRKKIASNHSATHLLHAALKQVLGNHVAQKGSLVGPSYLRFDFSHFAKMTDEEIKMVESIVNEKIRANIALDERRDVPLQEALEGGVTALFGEKYGEKVRVISFDPSFSQELCGGTHVEATGMISLFRINSESAVAAGVRRIEAITGEAALNYYREQNELLREIKELLNNAKDPLKAIKSLQDEHERMQKQLEALAYERAGAMKEELKKQVIDKGDVKFLSALVSVNSAEIMKNIAFSLKNELKGLVAVLGAEIEGKPLITVIIDEDLVKDKGLNASQIVRELSVYIKGGGGGQPFYATAGGSNAAGLREAILAAESTLQLT